MIPFLDLNLNTRGRSSLRVNGGTGSDNPQRGRHRPYATIPAAVADADDNSAVHVEHGAYDETVTIARTSGPLTIVDMVGRGAAYIEPSTEDTDGMVIHGDAVTLMNLGI